jgi:hypothetical protein
VRDKEESITSPFPCLPKKTKLELTWIGKEHRPRLEPRILLEEPDKSHHAKFRVREWPQENAKNSKNSDSLRSLRSFAATNEVVVETKTAIFMLEPKSKKDLEDSIVVAKKEAAERWCERASAHNSKHGEKPWEYALISHDKIAQNMTIEGLVAMKVQ